MSEKAQGKGVQQVHVFMDAELKRRIRSEADECGMSMSAFMRLCAVYFLEQTACRQETD